MTLRERRPVSSENKLSPLAPTCPTIPPIPAHPRAQLEASWSRSGDAAPAGDGSHHCRREAPYNRRPALRPVADDAERRGLSVRGTSCRQQGTRFGREAEWPQARQRDRGRRPREWSPPAHASSAEGRAKRRRGGCPEGAPKRGLPARHQPGARHPSDFRGAGRDRRAPQGATEGKEGSRLGCGCIAGRRSRAQQEPAEQQELLLSLEGEGHEP